MEYVKGLFDLSKLPAKFFFLFSIVSGFILFANTALIDQIQLAVLREKYGWIVGLVFVTSACLSSINIVIWIQKKLEFEWKYFKTKQRLRTRLRTLDPQEKAVIREFGIRQQSSIEMPIDDPVVGGLLDLGILKMNKQLGNSALLSGRFAALSLGKFAEKNLKIEYLGISANPSEDEVSFVMSNRPKWVERFGGLI